MFLNDLFAQAKPIEIKSMTSDSRIKNEEGIFFCFKGYRHNGHDFISEAISNGAKVIVHSEDVELDEKCIYIKVADVYKVYNQCLKIFYQNPSQNLRLIGVTGSFGKTSTAYLLKQILDKYTSCAYIGNMGFIYGDKHLPKIDINPENINHNLRMLAQQEIDVVIIECDAIDISEHIYDSLEFNIAIYTNLSKEKMDLYADLEDYIDSKRGLFNHLKLDDYAIINGDDEFANEIVENCIAKVISYGSQDDLDYCFSDIDFNEEGTSFRFKDHDNSYLINTNLIGDFSIYNLTACLTSLKILGFDINDVLDDLGYLYQASGRMNKIDVGQNFRIIIDIAKEFTTLHSVLKYAHKITPKNKKIVVCIGIEAGKDLDKHQKLAELLNDYADLVILTEDDPKNEDVYKICQNIAHFLKKEYIIITSRKEAIEEGVELMNSNDSLLILGKGDENFIYRSLGKEPYMGDSAVVRKYIKDRKEN